MTRAHLIAAIGIGVLVLRMSPADASTVGFDRVRCEKTHCGATLRYKAAPGERNQVVLTAPSRGATVFTDTGAVIDPAPASDPHAKCASLDPHTVRCETLADTTFTLVSLGGGDDTFRGTAYRVNGGPGNDRLEGEEGDDDLNGGGGRDRLIGGPGPDVLTDGDTSGAVDADSLDGGDGYDTLSFAGRAKGVRADLARLRGAGERGEGNSLRSFENLTGGRGDDYLAGDSRNNELYGAAGDDRLYGRSGRDEIAGGSGGDRLFGGPGVDDLLPVGPTGGAKDRGTDVLACGRDLDFAEEVQLNDAVMADCESAYTFPEYFQFRLSPLRSLRGWAARLRHGLACAERACVVLRIRTVVAPDGSRGPEPGVVVGRAQYNGRQDARTHGEAVPSIDPPRVRLSDRGRSLLRRYHQLWVRVDIAQRYNRRLRRAGFLTQLHVP